MRRALLYAIDFAGWVLASRPCPCGVCVAYQIQLDKKPKGDK